MNDLCLIYREESIEMGPRHAKPFYQCWHKCWQLQPGGPLPARRVGHQRKSNIPIINVFYPIFQEGPTKTLRRVPYMVQLSRTPSSMPTMAIWGWSPTREKSFEMGPRHVRPFKNTLIDAMVTWWWSPCKRVGNLSKPIIWMFMPNLLRGIHWKGSQTCQTLKEQPHQCRQGNLAVPY